MDKPARPSEVFLAHAPAALARDVANQPWFEATMAGLLETARSAWPELRLEPLRFAAFLAQRVDQETPVERLAVVDLYLAAACLDGDLRALTALDALIEAAASRLRLSLGDPLRDEVRQAARVKLLVAAPGNTPVLEAYSGRGSLAGWLKVVVARLLLDRTRTRWREVPTADPEALPTATPAVEDPEVAFLKAKYRTQFKDAFAYAVQGLGPRDRGVLRLHVIHAMSIDRIAACCGIGRSTAARWLAGIRERLLEDTRVQLTKTLALDLGEAQSLARVLHSDLDPSISRLLGRVDSDAGP